MARSEAIWVDSDVLLDWLASRQPWDAAALELIERAIQGEWEIWFSPLTLANIFYVYRKQAGAANAILAVETLARAGNIAPMEAAHVMQALASGRRDFEDEMQMACASGVPRLVAIITRNISDYEHGPFPAMTAESWIGQHPNSGQPRS